MAYLLGTESCIESLRDDLCDIQETIDEICTRSGPVRCYSWKSPDKLASDLPIQDLLDRFQFTNDEVDNQMAHYSLLELIIDRLLLLIYLSGSSIDTLLNEANESTARKASNSKASHVSGGLAVKKYWNKLGQLMSALRHVNNQFKSLKAKQCDPNITEPVRQPKQPVKPKASISNDVGFKSTQTNETSFVPCESCAKIQTNLKQNADQLINMCHYQDIKSHVGQYRASLMSNQLVGGWLSGAELDKWLIEQDKDLARVSKQLEFLSKNNEMLKAKITENEVKTVKLVNVEKELKKNLQNEKDSQAVTMKQYEKKLDIQRIELEEKIKGLETEVKTLANLKTSLDEKYDKLNNLHENNENIIVQLNETNRTIAGELEVKCEQKEKLQRSEEELVKTRTELECTRRQLVDKNVVIGEERAKLEQLIRSQESLKTKHEVLNDTLDKLTVEKEQFEKKYKTVEQEKEHLETLEFEKETLHRSISELKSQVKKLQDNELLLLRYPDLYGPIEQTEEVTVSEEMQNQIAANEKRIGLLENLNSNLINSVKKLDIVNSRANSRAHSRNESVISKASIDMNETRQDYFMKLEDQEPIEKQKSFVPSRAYPLFKLDSEIESEKKHWKPTESYNEIERTTSRNTRTPGDLPIEPIFNNDNTPHISDDDEALDDFMSNKHEADQSYLNKLKQIGQNSELKVESNTDFSQMKRRNVSSREHSFLYSPAASPAPTDRNVSSKMSMYSVGGRVNSAKGNNRTPIPPADKTMEVVVGKGRRGSASGPSRQTTSTPTSKALPPQTPTCQRTKSAVKSATSHSATASFQCTNCPKKYNNKKDLDIHKMYC